ncbi:hypothetical protein F0562_033388 [Nyssa sinensis]|uniref:Uncharacterized protein n=1 Tax=Nyssa sinensis TaxID=561372 RepID=A0A5J5AS00_9ASTE|nr:hypothetical protein F0562_033388 [Nyssa sinensis]
MSNKKVGKPMAAYMSRVKSLVDDLALIGHPLNNAQIVTYILNGLGDEFKELVAAVRVHDTPISFEDLYDKLLDEELLCNHGVPKEEEVQVTAQLLLKGRSGRGGHRGGYTNTTHGLATNLSEKHFQPPHLQTNQQQHSYGRGLCSSQLQSYPPLWNQKHYQGNQGQPRVISQLCDKPGHSAQTCRSRGLPSSFSSRPQAHLAEGEPSPSNTNWVLDSGATHHITSDLQNLSMHSDYCNSKRSITAPQTRPMTQSKAQPAASSSPTHFRPEQCSSGHYFRRQ